MSFDATNHVLYDGGRAPNPRRVAIFLAEKRIRVTLRSVDMGALEHKSDSITALNPLMQMPILKLPDGRILTESIAICRYFEALVPTPALFGADPVEAAFVEMWQRRIEFRLLYPVAQTFRHIHPAMSEWEVPQIAEWGEANKPKALTFANLLNDHLENHQFICGEEFSVADITAMIAMDFSKVARIKYGDELSHLHRWLDAARARPSYRA